MKRKIHELSDLEKMLFTRFYIYFRLKEDQSVHDSTMNSLNEISLLRGEIE